MSFTYRAGHLGDAVDHYVDGALDAESSRRAATHLLTCDECRREVDAERAILRKVRAVRMDPARHASLVAGLMALGSAGGRSGDARGEPGQDARSVNAPALGEPAEPGRSVLRGRSAVVAGALALGAVSGVVVTAGTGARTAPMPMRSAQHAPSTLGRSGAARVVIVGLRTPASDQVMRAKRTRSGRMDP